MVNLTKTLLAHMMTCLKIPPSISHRLMVATSASYRCAPALRLISA